jgi:hypothetical protein
MKMAVFWVVAPCSLVEVHRRTLLIALMMEAASTTETSVNFYQTTRRYNPEASHLHILFALEPSSVPKKEEVTGGDENYTVRSFVTYTPHQIG